jgi:hypothetical protein
VRLVCLLLLVVATTRSTSAAFVEEHANCLIQFDGTTLSQSSRSDCSLLRPGLADAEARGGAGWSSGAGIFGANITAHASAHFAAFSEFGGDSRAIAAFRVEIPFRTPGPRRTGRLDLNWEAFGIPYIDPAGSDARVAIEFEGGRL